MIENRRLKRFAEDKYLSSLEFTENNIEIDYSQKCDNCHKEIPTGTKFCQIYIWVSRDLITHDIELCLDCKKKIENGN